MCRVGLKGEQEPLPRSQGAVLQLAAMRDRPGGGAYQEAGPQPPGRCCPGPGEVGRAAPRRWARMRCRGAAGAAATVTTGLGGADSSGPREVGRASLPLHMGAAAGPGKRGRRGGGKRVGGRLLGGRGAEHMEPGRCR